MPEIDVRPATGIVSQSHITAATAQPRFLCDHSGGAQSLVLADWNGATIGANGTPVELADFFGRCLAAIVWPEVAP